MPKIKSAVAVLISIAILAGAGIVVTHQMSKFYKGLNFEDDFAGPGSGEVIVTVLQGQEGYAIADTLVEQGVILQAKKFDMVSANNPKSQTIQAGRYRLKKGMTAQQALEALLDPASKITANVTIVEGKTLKEIMTQLSTPFDPTKPTTTGVGIPLAEFQKAAKSPKNLGLPEYAEDQVEGFTFPATYPFVGNSPNATAVLSEMITKFEAVAKEIGLEKKAAARNLTVRQVVTAASIIQLEVRDTKDMPKVAEVIYNRLDQRMTLGMDSTVHYYSGKTGGVYTSAEERASDNPYNTYKFQGLPPGPIGTPGKAALEAALNPTKDGWLFFVTVNQDTGETKFSKDFATHDKYVAEGQEWCRKFRPGKC